MNVIRSYGGFRPYLPDHLPIIGPDPRLSGLWHATGHEGAGIGLAIVTADLLTAQFLDRTPICPPRPFRLDRPSLCALTCRRRDEHTAEPQRRRHTDHRRRPRPDHRRRPADHRPIGLAADVPGVRAARPVLRDGVCFDCLVTVNGDRDVRACQRRASDGDVVETQS